MKYIQNRTNWCWVAACKVVGEQYKKNFTEFAFTLESQETEVAVSNLDGYDKKFSFIHCSKLVFDPSCDFVQ